MKSRKRNLTYIFTAQLLELLDKRVRKILDFTAYCMLNRDESVGKVQVFRTGYPNAGSYMKTFYYKTPEVFTLYNTNEEICMEEESKEKLTFRFQESPEHSPIFFEDWSEADKFAEDFWNKLVKKKGGLPF
jgi:hypothetical protein